MGFDFRLEIFDNCEDHEIAANPKRPNPVWWLPDPDPEREEDRHHH